MPGGALGQTNMPLPGFTTNRVFDERVLTFRYAPDIRIHINAPAPEQFDAGRPTGLALYALPNGNSIEQTVGKKAKPGDDWRYDIQHIGAQTRFLRRHVDDYNLVVIYLEAAQKSWPAWKAAHEDHAQQANTLVADLTSRFAHYRPFIVLTGHSGGGRFIFSYLDGCGAIPGDVRRICFLDSNYGYERRYGEQLKQWLRASPHHCLSVLAYDDAAALYEGKPFVSATGGTWHRSKRMQADLAEAFSFTTLEDEAFIRHTALDNRVQFILKLNPQRAVLHTVQVERNGFIHSMLTGTKREGVDYRYYGERAYEKWIQEDASR